MSRCALQNSADIGPLRIGRTNSIHTVPDIYVAVLAQLDNHFAFPANPCTCRGK